MIKILLTLILIPVFLILASAYYISTDGDAVHKISSYITSNYVKDLKIDFDKINIKLVTKSILKRNLLLSSKHQCIKYSSAEICLENILIELNFDLSSPQNFIINQLDIRITKARFSKDKSKTTESSPINIYEMYQALYSLYRENLKRAPKSLHIEGEDIIIDEGEKLNFLINRDKISLGLLTKSFNLKVDLKSSQTSSFIGKLNFINQQLKISSEVSLSFYKDILLNLKSKMLLGSMHIAINPQIIFAEIFSFKVENSIITLPDAKFKIKMCQFSITDSPKHSLNCPKINLSVDAEPILEIDFESQIKNTIDFLNTKEVLHAKVTTKESQSDLFKLNLLAVATIDVQKNEFTPRLEKFKWKLHFDRFQKLVTKLEKSSFAIFAPFNTMDGKVQLESEKVIGINNDGYTIPLDAFIDLNDQKKNALKFKFNGELKTFSAQKPNLSGALSIEQIRINIPQIDPIGGIPRITGSTRVKNRIESKKKKTKEVPINYNIKVSTKTNESIKLYYYLLEPYLAFGVKATISNDSMAISLKGSKKVTISYLKRDLDLDSFAISTKQEEKTEININSSHYTSGYKIYLKIIGTLDKPKLILSSYPTLPRDDIISLLIFKRKASAITGSQRQSVGGTEAAIADRALGLFSIWAFASTPIEYVAYDSNTQTYSASISLPGNTSFKIGTNWESVSALTLRKQLSDTWAIETSYNPNDERESKNVMLQKEINF